MWSDQSPVQSERKDKSFINLQTPDQNKGKDKDKDTEAFFWMDGLAGILQKISWLKSFKVN